MNIKTAIFGFLCVIIFPATAQPQVITANGSTLDQAIEKIEEKAQRMGSTINKITSAGGKNYIHASAIIEPIKNVELENSTKVVK